jgi:hypothetical protein
MDLQKYIEDLKERKEFAVFTRKLIENAVCVNITWTIAWAEWEELIHDKMRLLKRYSDKSRISDLALSMRPNNTGVPGDTPLIVQIINGPENPLLIDLGRVNSFPGQTISVDKLEKTIAAHFGLEGFSSNWQVMYPKLKITPANPGTAFLCLIILPSFFRYLE